MRCRAVPRLAASPLTGPRGPPPLRWLPSNNHRRAGMAGASSSLSIWSPITYLPCASPPQPLTAGVPGVTWKAFILNNLIPVTLGNIVAGTLCVATLYSLAYGALGERVQRALGASEALRSRRAMRARRMAL